MAIDISYWLQPALVEPYTYGLFFLLGSFTVASLSDVRRMSAQSEFLHIWLAVVVVLFFLDIYQLREQPMDRFIVKWVAISLLSVLSSKYVGAFFRLEWGDVCAIAAVCGLLSPLLVLLFFAILKVVDRVMRPFLRHFGREGAYPFMPVVAVATLVTIPIAALLQGLPLVF
jgi:prepilin signal peptidase PulO-like enzyme (type II secretory pathway)